MIKKNKNQWQTNVFKYELIVLQLLHICGWFYNIKKLFRIGSIRLLSQGDGILTEKALWCGWSGTQKLMRNRERWAQGNMPFVVMNTVAREGQWGLMKDSQMCPLSVNTYDWPKRAEGQNTTLPPSSQVRAIPLILLIVFLSFETLHFSSDTVLWLKMTVEFSIAWVWAEQPGGFWGLHKVLWGEDVHPLNTTYRD